MTVFRAVGAARGRLADTEAVSLQDWDSTLFPCGATPNFSTLNSLVETVVGAAIKAAVKP